MKEKKINGKERRRAVTGEWRETDETGGSMETPPRLTSSQLSDKRRRRKSSIVSTGLGREKHRCLFSEGVIATVMKKALRWVDFFHSLSNFSFFVKARITNLFYSLFNSSVLPAASVAILVFSQNTSSLPFPVSASFFVTVEPHFASLHRRTELSDGPQGDKTYLALTNSTF